LADSSYGEKRVGCLFGDLRWRFLPARGRVLLENHLQKQEVQAVKRASGLALRSPIRGADEQENTPAPPSRGDGTSLLFRCK
jgi:hypothetical protein